MPSPPSTHRPLNPKQYEILDMLYRFRYATTSLLAEALNLKSKIKMNERLSVLLDQEYIGRKYDSEYRLQRKHATYYLLTKGVNALRQKEGSGYNPAILYNIRKDRSASDRFINHCLAVFESQCVLATQYGPALRFFTKSQTAQYEYFPQPAPDAFIRLKANARTANFFLVLVRKDEPFFAAARRVKQLARYVDEGEWDATGTEMPVVLFICDTGSIQKKLSKTILRAQEDIEEELKSYLTSWEEFKNMANSKNGAIWHPADDLSEAHSLDRLH